MNISLTKIIESWITDNSKVIDFGCGDGSLLQFLIDNKNVNGYGVEIDHEKIQQCVEKGLSVIEQDIDEGIQDFVSSNFDFAIMASSIQCLKNPHIALGRMLDLSKQCVVTLPNLGYWRCRLNLLSGKMPVTPNLPSSWYETDNLHLCTIKDFEKLCASRHITIKSKSMIGGGKLSSFFSAIWPNLFAMTAIYRLSA